MVKKIDEIAELIPSESTRVRKYFDLFISEKTSAVARYPLALVAMTFSMINSMTYALDIPRHFVLAPYHRSFTPLKNAASSSWDSLGFIAHLTTFIAATWFNPSQYSPKPYQLKTDFEPAIHQALWKAPENWQPKTHSYKVHQFEGFTILSDLSIGEEALGERGKLEISSLAELYHLLDGDCVVLVMTSDKKGYLLKKDNSDFKEGVQHETLSKIEKLKVENPQPQDLIVIINDEPSNNNEPSLAGSILQLSSNPRKINDIENSWTMVSSMAIRSKQPVTPQSQPSIFGLAIETLEQIRKTFENCITNINNIKYRHIQNHFRKLVDTQDCRDLYSQASNGYWGNVAEACRDLHQHILSDSFSNPLEWYQQFVAKLRAAAKFVGTTTTNPTTRFILLLASERFAGVSLYGYCLNLVEMISGKFDQPLKLGTFWDEFQRRNDFVKTVPQPTFSMFSELWRKTKGVTNAFFDPLGSENVPYIYGILQLENGKNITVLRHGTPVAQTGVPEITPDYKAFVKAAKMQNLNILHVILENGDPKYLPFGDESQRVQARLELGKETNFFPIALRMDGPFFKPKNYKPCTIEDLKKQFSEQLFGKLTGFLLPEKMQELWTKKHFESCMDLIHKTYFKDQVSLESLADYQAFILLTYAEMTLSLCSALDISILEALCKDDKDRGGVFKATLTLHSLYKNNAITPEALQEVMVNLIAAPFTINQQTIIDDRGILIHHVLEMMKKSYQENPNVKGEKTFQIVPTPYQSVVPTGNMCISKEEYDQFISHVKNGDIVLKSPPTIMTTLEIYHLTQSLFANTHLAYTVNQVVDGVLPIYEVIDDKEQTIAYVTASIEKLEGYSTIVTLLTPQTGSTCKTKAEYEAFVKSVSENPITIHRTRLANDPSIQDISKVCESYFQNTLLGYSTKIEKFSGKSGSVVVHGPNGKKVADLTINIKDDLVALKISQ